LRKFSRFDAGREPIQALARIVTYALIASMFFVLMEIFTVFYSGIPEHMQHFRYLFVGLHGHHALVPWMWAAVALAVLALVLLINPRTRRNDTLLGLACAAVFASLWIEKGLGLVVTGFIPSPLEKITEYSPTGPEVAITVGVWAGGLLILTVLYKIALAVRLELEG
jgi:molybdopterin-containing oxidoreductase family membrane subunit